MGWFSFLDDVFKRRSQPSSLGNQKIEQERLKSEQRALADEIEALFRRFDSRLQELAMRAHAMSAADFDRQAEILRASQENLRMALRRLESSLKSTRELERELGEWEDREDEGLLHPDHPKARAEMIRSELAVRGVTRELTNKFLKEFVASKQAQACTCDGSCHSAASDKEAEESPTSSEPPLYQFRSYERVPRTEAEHLVQAIREATREAERWHAVPMQLHDYDTIDQVHHLRELHAVLKQLDREQGVTRDRIELAVHLHDVR